MKKKSKTIKMSQKFTSQESDFFNLAKSIYLSPTLSELPQDYYAYVDDNGAVVITKDKSKQMTYEQIKDEILKKR